MRIMSESQVAVTAINGRLILAVNLLWEVVSFSLPLKYFISWTPVLGASCTCFSFALIAQVSFLILFFAIPELNILIAAALIEHSQIGSIMLAPISDKEGDDAVVERLRQKLNLSSPVQLHHHHHCCHYCDNQVQHHSLPQPKAPQNDHRRPSPVATRAAATITSSTSFSILDDRLDCRHFDALGDDALQWRPLRRSNQVEGAGIASDCNCTAPTLDVSVDVSSCKRRPKLAKAQTTRTLQSQREISSTTTQIQTTCTNCVLCTQKSPVVRPCDVTMLTTTKKKKKEMASSRTFTSSSFLSPLCASISPFSPSSVFSTSCSSTSSQFIRLLLFSCFLLTVISSSAHAYSSRTGYLESELPPYSHYYPPYLIEDVRIQQPPTNRQGKANGGRILAKAPAVPATRQYLDGSTFTGGEVTGHAVLRRQRSLNTFDQSRDDQPDYRITGDIFVPQGAKLEIEPGVRMAFAPRIGITVRGSLLANVSVSILSFSCWLYLYFLYSFT